MKLNTFNTNNVASVRRGKAAIRIHRKTGLFSFTRQASEKLELFGKDVKIDIHQDESRPTDWYISINSSDSGFEVRDKHSSGQSAFNSTCLAEKVFTSIEYGEISGSMLIGEPQEEGGLILYPIITKSISK